MIDSPTRHFEKIVVLYFIKEQEGTLEELLTALGREVTPRERKFMAQAFWVLQKKNVIERIGYCGHYMNYRITETALSRGLKHTTKRGTYAEPDHSDSCRREPRGTRREP